ncbi:MAG: hypothetical protein HZB81_03470 [Deltaproteobacteria bacterium]|nr:hypothetical protein [Deltaproteobacteria bacterium]
MPNTDWKSIVGSVAPTIATALGGPLAGMAVSAISQAVLGKPDADEAEIGEAIVKSNNPEILLKLKTAEQEFAAKMKQLDIDMEKIAADDRASARQREVAVKDTTPRNLAYLYTVGYFVMISALFKFGVPEGSSAGSAKKSEMMDKLLKK